MKIPELVRIHIFDRIKESNIPYYGRMKELNFIKDVFFSSLSILEDEDWNNLYEDFLQHRVRNIDWDEYWVFEHELLNLQHCDSIIFKEFILKTIHPKVRTNKSEINQLIKIYNQELTHISITIGIKGNEYGYPIYDLFRKYEHVSINSISEINNEFTNEQYKKCLIKLNKGDFYGALVNARTLVESVIGEVYFRSTGKKWRV